MASMNEEVALMLTELLNNNQFQKALNDAGNNIGIPIDRFDELKEYLPEGTPWTMGNANQALQYYRANIIVETRKLLKDIAYNMKIQNGQFLTEDESENEDEE